MLARTLNRLAACLVAAGGLLLPLAADAGDCGCEDVPAASACHHHHHHYRHRTCHRCSTLPPSGMVVPSMAMPMMAAPVMAAPVSYTLAPPTYSLAPVQAAPQYQLQPSTCAGTSALTQDQLVRALAMLTSPGAGNAATAPASAPNQSLEGRVADLERRVQTLEAVTRELETLSKDTVDVLKRHAAELKALSGK
ncbi:MAG: hypothetical protein L0211_16895 [Planctomycetaceae bacterium]|nr:hypothetical protein [Planctomycetaceae bacterium]